MAEVDQDLILRLRADVRNHRAQAENKHNALMNHLAAVKRILAELDGADRVLDMLDPPDKESNHDKN